MDCPNCGSTQTKVVHVAKFQTINVRTRKCLSEHCSCVFLTEEILREDCAAGKKPALSGNSRHESRSSL